MQINQLKAKATIRIEFFTRVPPTKPSLSFEIAPISADKLLPRQK